MMNISFVVSISTMHGVNILFKIKILSEVKLSFAPHGVTMKINTLNVFKTTCAKRQAHEGSKSAQ
jgi:hypothetical protein